MVRKSQPRTAPPTFRLRIWQPDGDLWFVDPTELRQAIAASGASEEQMQRKMGQGYGKLADALAGKSIGRYSVALIEWGLLPTEA